MRAASLVRKLDERMERNEVAQSRGGDACTPIE